MSYYESNYYRNPGPFYSGPDFDAPVPGWGVLPNIAGAARIAVGQTPMIAPEVLKKLSPELQAAMDIDDGKSSLQGLPLWMGVGVTLGLGVAFAQNKGWLRGLGLKR